MDYKTGKFIETFIEDLKEIKNLYPKRLNSHVRPNKKGPRLVLFLLTDLIYTVESFLDEWQNEDRQTITTERVMDTRIDCQIGRVTPAFN